MKKILTKIISCIASLMIIPSSCKAWTNDAIRIAYEANFDSKYLYSIYGIQALTFMLSKRIPFYSIEKLQMFLEDNYEFFQPLFETLDRNKLEEKYWEIAGKYRSPYNSKRIKMLPITPFEKLNTMKRLESFGPSDQTIMLNKIKSTFGLKKDLCNLPNLLSLATVISSRLSLYLDRGAKRQKSVLLKWYSENWDQILTIAPQIQLDM